MADVQGSPEQGLQRRLGVFKLTATGVGIILGAGIYVLIGEAAGLAGDIGSAGYFADLTGFSKIPVMLAYTGLTPVLLSLVVVTTGWLVTVIINRSKGGRARVMQD